MNKRKTQILYLVLFFVTLILFLYVLFPEDKVNRHLSNTVRQLFPDYAVSISASRPSLPVALKLTDVSVERTGEEIFRLQTIKIGRPVLSLFSPGQSYRINAKAYGGAIEGMITTKQANTATAMNADFRLSQVEIQDIPLIAQRYDHEVPATLSGTLTYDNTQTPGRGTINLHVSDITVPVSILNFKLGDLHFADVTIEGTLNQQDLSITRCEAKGNQASTALSGVIVLKMPADNSLLSLSGTLEPHHELLTKIPRNILPMDQMGSKGLPFTISGTFKKPFFSFR